MTTKSGRREETSWKFTDYRSLILEDGIMAIQIQRPCSSGDCLVGWYDGPVTTRNHLGNNFLSRLELIEAFDLFEACRPFCVAGKHYFRAGQHLLLSKTVRSSNGLSSRIIILGNRSARIKPKTPPVDQTIRIVLTNEIKWAVRVLLNS